MEEDSITYNCANLELGVVMCMEEHRFNWLENLPSRDGMNRKYREQNNKVKCQLMQRRTHWDHRVHITAGQCNSRGVMKFRLMC
jgi:hypothetical protein